MKKRVRTDQVASTCVPNEKLREHSGLFCRCNMKLGPQHRVWASQTKTFEIDYVREVGNQIDVVLTIGDDQLVIGRNGGVSKQSGRKRLENQLAVHRLQNAASPKLVYGRKTGDSRDGRMTVKDAYTLVPSCCVRTCLARA